MSELREKGTIIWCELSQVSPSTSLLSHILIEQVPRSNDSTFMKSFKICDNSRSQGLLLSEAHKGLLPCLNNERQNLFVSDPKAHVLNSCAPVSKV